MTFEQERSGHGPRTTDVRARSAGHAERAVRTGGLGRAWLTGVLALALIALPATSFANDAARETSREGGLGAAAALSTLVYGPVKLVYATGGLIVGAFAWAFTAGDSEVAEKVFTRSLRGHYVVTPDHLTGERELVFIGRDVAGESTAPPAAVASAPPSVTESDDDGGYDEMGW